MRNKPISICVMLVGGAVYAEPQFAPISAPHHVYSGGWEHFVGGGIAAFDCNGDHLPDLFAAGGAEDARLLRNTSSRGGEVTFIEATPVDLALEHVVGAYPLDIDNDNILDLAVLRVGPNLLLKGGEDCSFEPFKTLGFESPDKWSTAFSATWEDGQKLPTLAFGNYVDRNAVDGPFRACDSNALYRPNDKTYEPPAPLAPGFCALSMLFSDWGRRGQTDLRVSNDRHYYVDGGEEQLWKMTYPPRLFSEQDGWNSFKLWGMGIASRDLTGDGQPEVFLSSMGDQRLQSLIKGSTGPTYQDVPFESGTTAHRPYVGGDGRPSTGWHISFGDVQNDGRDDVFISKGNVEQMPDSAMNDPNNLLVQGTDGNFVERGDVSGLASPHRGRGAVMMDFNLDGLLDLAVVNRRAPLEIYQNITENAGNWISVLLTQPAPNVSAIGAWIELDDGRRIQARELTVGGGHAGGASGPEHFGLGTMDEVRLRIIWPDGEKSPWTTAQAGQMLSVTRSSDGVTLVSY